MLRTYTNTLFKVVLISLLSGQLKSNCTMPKSARETHKTGLEVKLNMVPKVTTTVICFLKSNAMPDQIIQGLEHICGTFSSSFTLRHIAYTG